MTEFSQMRLLVVDGDRARRESVCHTLAQAGYTDVLSTGEPTDAPQLCASERPDLIVLDLDMPGFAFQVLAKIRHLIEPPESLPVLVVTDDVSPDTRDRAVLLGVRDFVAKPVAPGELLFRVRNALYTHSLQQRLDHRDTGLSDVLRDRSSDLDTARESLSVLAAIADYHDDDTYHHAQRVGIGAALIGQALDLPDSFVDMLRDAAPLHDIGKVGMSRRILLKPDKLTPAEWMHMMRHVEIGAQILASARSPVLRLAGEIARTHHERWDGNGYLAGLTGTDIPLSGRITALADVWDTLTHERPYKKAWDEDRALAEIQAQAGSHFDPRVVEAFSTIDWRELNVILASELAERAA
ncbi:MAG TPA: HD domain-containing phosphohydrolase [Solirubrobacteraceae bacterium]|jgi:putative two-component system response regulator|nr:HD domain-containing phosphohydrolase [Solirubrobacteraceae bacterium]